MCSVAFAPNWVCPSMMYCRASKTGEAIARLAADYDLAQTLAVQGSPTYIMNEGRQKLFGNVAYGILDANITELVSGASEAAASNCD